jgi:hypothetical protein
MNHSKWLAGLNFPPTFPSGVPLSRLHDNLNGKKIFLCQKRNRSERLGRDPFPKLD